MRHRLAEPMAELHILLLLIVLNDSNPGFLNAMYDRVRCSFATDCGLAVNIQRSNLITNTIEVWLILVFQEIQLKIYWFE